MAVRSGEIDDLSSSEELQILAGGDTVRNETIADKLVDIANTLRTDSVIRSALDDGDVSMTVHGEKLVIENHFPLMTPNIRGLLNGFSKELYTLIDAPVRKAK